MSRKTSSDEIVKIYDTWTENNYDKVVNLAPRIAAKIVTSLYKESHKPDIEVLDVGAGTGQVGLLVRTNTGYYDCVTAACCVIPGHIEGDGLYDFIKLVKKGGYIVIVLRGHWPDVPSFFESFVAVIQDLVNKGKMKIVQQNEIKNYSPIIPNST